MNRGIVSVGLLTLFVAIGLLTYPFATTGVEQFGLVMGAGVFVLPVSLSVILWGASAPNPDVTTVGGVFGNRDEDAVRRMLSPKAAVPEARFLPGPRESMNCLSCYTAIPWDIGVCPRCGRPRECRACGRPLFLLAGAVRCGPCVRLEAYCNCPKPKHPRSVHAPARSRRV
ncbi:MAG: hypothetical protein L3K09_05320 [Thermoplasmata archaeon]|nr:hypothetical protein [Thermoplasmata archaeon]